MRVQNSKKWKGMEISSKDQSDCNWANLEKKTSADNFQCPWCMKVRFNAEK